MDGLTAVSLFAGIEGIGLALKRSGVRVVAAVEIDPACRAVIRRHFPEVKLFNDVTEVTGDQLRAAGFVPRRGILAGGWPCQGNSIAGRRGGMADPRSGLWMHVARLLAELRPRWFLGENVPGLLSVNGGRDIAVVRHDLAQLGYWWAERILDAQHFGVPQRRRRVFFVGCPGDPRGPVQVLLEPESGDRHPAAREEARAGTAPATGGGAVSALQGGGRRGHRIDAEGAAGGHLIAQTITAREGKGPDSDATNGNDVAVRGVPIALRGRGDSSQIEFGDDDEPAFALRTPAGGGSYPMVATFGGADASEDGTGRGTPIISLAVAGDFSSSEDRAQTVRSAHGQPGVIGTSAAVRRLTPLECERLQGFPDGWTDGQADATRYRQLGNSVAVPVVEWITRRIVAVDASLVAAKGDAA